VRLKTKEKQMKESDKLVAACSFLVSVHKGVLNIDKYPPVVGITLGSGLGYMTELLKDGAYISYADIPHCPKSSAPDHAGCLWFGQLKGVNVVMCQGRVHLYEGRDVQEVVFLTRLMAMLGAKQVILTHATGATTNNLKPRDIVGIRDHIALDCPDPTAGAREPEFEKKFGFEFTPMAKAYSPRLLALAEECALECQVAFRLGVSYFKKGRTFETAAEIEKMRRDGADVATMSTVPEVIAAFQLGVEVLDLALVTNMGTGLGDVSHASVVDVAKSMKEKFGGLITAIVPRMAALANEEKIKE
jgi:purine-nucleoside phosphorylase